MTDNGVSKDGIQGLMDSVREAVFESANKGEFESQLAPLLVDYIGHADLRRLVEVTLYLMED